jgi:outer membrane receptor protein involved in Fe transport
VSRTATIRTAPRQQVFGLDTTVRWFRVQGQPDHQLAAEYQRREHRRSEQLPPGHFYDIPGTNPALISDKTNEVTTKALFAENRLALTDKLALLTGLRYDDIDLDVTNHRTVTATNPKHLKRSWEPVTGRVGLTYQFIPSANVYVQYSTAAEQPNGTQDFDVSTGKQWEIGSKFDYLNGRGSATVAAYTIERKDFVVTDPLDPTSSIPVGQQTSRHRDRQFPADHRQAVGRRQLRLGRCAVRRLHRKECRRRGGVAQGQHTDQRPGPGRQSVADL